MPGGQNPQQGAQQPGCRRIKDQPWLTGAVVRILHPVGIEEACMPGPRNLHPGEQVKVEIMPTGIPSHEQHASRNQRRACDQKGRHPTREGRMGYGVGRQGTSRKVCVVDAVTAASVKGIGNVLPLYQDGNWSRKFGLSGSPDSPITMFSVDPSTLLQSTVRRWLAPSSPRTWFNVVSSPHSWWGPVLVQLRKKGSMPYRGCCTLITCWLP